MVFRPSFQRRSPKSNCVDPLIVQVANIPSVDGNSISQKVFLERVPMTEVQKKIISPDVYTLENLLNSGTPIPDVDVSNLFSIPQHLAENYYSKDVVNAFEKLQSIVEPKN